MQPGRSVAGYETGQSARAMGQVGQVLGKIGEEISREEDAQAFGAARRQVDEWERTTVHDPEKGAVALKGKQAFDLPKMLPAAFDKFADQVAAGLTTNRQRQAFEQLRESRRERLGSWADGHAFKQREAYNLGEFEADVDGYHKNAVSFANDTKMVKTELAMQKTRIEGFLGGKVAPQAVEQAVQAAAGKTNTGVLQSLIANGNLTQAREYFSDPKVKASLDDRTRAMFAKDIAHQSDLIEANETARAHWAEFGPKGRNDPINLAEGGCKACRKKLERRKKHD